MQKTTHKIIRKGDVWVFAADVSLLEKKLGCLDENEIVRIQLEYVKYVTD